MAGPPAEGPPPALDGFCPVELLETETWARGQRRWAVTHRGRTYLLSGPDKLERFLANPDRYAPVLSGLDAVLAVDHRQEVPGSTEFCVVYDGRLYTFSGPESVARFRETPSRYAVVARQPLY
jgi:YHS domain-containing protein